MRYVDSGKNIQAGDLVMVEDGASGVVVCDFDGKKFMPGFEDWSSDRNISREGIPHQGVLINTNKYGLLYYESEDDTIKNVI